MPEFHIGRYTYYTYSKSPNYYYLHSNGQSNKDNIVKSYDRRLHESLDNIFRERCSSSNSSSQFKKFRCDLQHNTDWKSIIKPILEQEPAFSELFSREELGKLSLLWISVLAGYTDSAELLVRSGADVNELFGRHDPQVIDEKWTVLHVLLQMDPSPENELLVRLVTDRGTDLQARDCRERTVLHYAVEESRVQMTEMFLEKGADVNAADDQGLTPLLVAVSNSEFDELVPLLMKHGADVFVKDAEGRNALYYLSNSMVEHAELAKVFIEKGVSLDDKACHSLSQPIHQAALRKHNELLKLFLDHGANVNSQTKNGEYPLYLAARFDCNIEVMQTLLKRGASINLKTNNGHTALHGACENSVRIYSIDSRKESIVSITSTIKLLLSAGADVLAEDSEGNTPLALILSRGNVEQPGSKLLIKALALKKARQPSIELKDERIIGQSLRLQEYYQDCMNEINRMKSTRFIDNCTFFELFTKSHCQIATLMRNPNFKTRFGQYDLSGFPTCAEDIRQAFNSAQKHYYAILDQANVINEAVYNILPDLVVDKVIHYIFDCCENMK